MKRFIFAIGLVLALGFSSCAPKEKHTYAEIETNLGTIKVLLYNSTPVHRDNFIKLANEGFYEGSLFHRIVSGFMLQGGDPDSKTAIPGQQLGMGGPGYLLDPEIGAPHIKGALGAARTQNPEKRSSGSQFYIIQGRAVTDAILDQMEQQKGIKYNEAQRNLYKELGGSPFLDNDYTVFGEVVEGMEIIDEICAVQVDQYKRPLEDIKMNVRILDENVE